VRDAQNGELMAVRSAERHGHWAVDREGLGVAAGSRARKRAVAPWTRWREAFVWHRFAGGVLTHPCGSCRPAGSWRRCGRGGGADCTGL